MKTQIDPQTKRLSIAVAVLIGLLLIGSATYLFLMPGSAKPVNGRKILTAARDYTRSLKQNHSPIPPTVSLQYLIDNKFLQPEDIGSLQGLDATIALTATGGANNVLMRVRLPDGTDYTLQADGTPSPPSPAKKP